MLNKLSKNHMELLLVELEKKTISFPKLDKLLNKYDDVNVNNFINDSTKTTLMHRLVQHSKILSVKWLLQKDANPYIEDIHTFPAFFYFVNSAHPKEFFELFKEFNIDFNYKNSKGRIVLQDIVLNGDVPLFKKVVESTKKPFSQDKYKRNILFDAVLSGKDEIIDAVFELKGSDLNIQDENKDSLLHVVKHGRLEVISFLLTKGVSPSLQDIYGRNIIYYLSERMESSTSESEIEKISELIELALRFKEVLEQKDQRGDNLLTNFLKNLQKPLAKYSQKQFLSKLINKFIDKGIDIDETDEDGNNALMISVSKNDLETANLLLSKGANANMQNKKFATPLETAVMQADKEYLDMIKLLLTYGAKPDIRDEKNMNLMEKIIYILIYTNNYDESIIPFSIESLAIEEDEDIIMNFSKDGILSTIFEIILQSNICDLNELDSQGNPYFFILLMTHNDTYAKQLFRYGANVNQVNENKKNILQYYLEFQGQEETLETKRRIKELIKYGINLDYRDDFGGTIMHNTVLKNSLDINVNIYNCGANINVFDAKGRTLLHNAIWANKLDVIKFLLKKKSDLINIADNFGVLPINYAAFIGNKELVCFLIKEKSFINNTNEIPKHIIDFLKRFHKNIQELENERYSNPREKSDVMMLLTNMKREFRINY